VAHLRRRRRRALARGEPLVEIATAERCGTRLRAAYLRMVELDPVAWTAGHNGTLVDLLRHLTRNPATTPHPPRTVGRGAGRSRPLIDAVAERATDRAAKIAEEHMAAAREIRLQMAGESP
jgi:DNA-binding GntR family transcriptional regulator